MNEYNTKQLVKKERASAVEAMICNMAMQGKMDSKISEGKLIEMLENIVGASQTKQGNSSKMTFARKKNAFDSDSDDNDDDLLQKKVTISMISVSVNNSSNDQVTLLYVNVGEQKQWKATSLLQVHAVDV